MTYKLAGKLILSFCLQPQFNDAAAKDCFMYMSNCVYNLDIIGTPDSKTNKRVTLESRLDDCRTWFNQQK